MHNVCNAGAQQGETVVLAIQAAGHPMASITVAERRLSTGHERVSTSQGDAPPHNACPVHVRCL